QGIPRGTLQFPPELDDLPRGGEGRGVVLAELKEDPAVLVLAFPFPRQLVNELTPGAGRHGRLPLATPEYGNQDHGAPRDGCQEERKHQQQNEGTASAFLPPPSVRAGRIPTPIGVAVGLAHGFCPGKVSVPHDCKPRLVTHGPSSYVGPGR